MTTRKQENVKGSGYCLDIIFKTSVHSGHKINNCMKDNVHSVILMIFRQQIKNLGILSLFICTAINVQVWQTAHKGIY